jgi:hypothetical protein
METIVLVHLLFIYESVLVKDIGVVLDYDSNCRVLVLV